MDVGLEMVLAGSEGRRQAAATAASLRAARLVRRMREAAGLSQVDLAKRLSVNQARISALENGLSRQGPTAATLESVAEACGFQLSMNFSPKAEAREETAVDRLLSAPEEQPVLAATE
jgi:transcriptional regulator with XRE-family HTH domain